MPVFVVATNVARADIPEGFMQRLSEVMAKQTGKPEKYVSIRVIPDQMMLRGGSTAPCAECYFSSIGAVSEQENLGHSQALTDIITQDLKVEKDRMYIFFENLERANVAWNGRTFATL